MTDTPQVPDSISSEALQNFFGSSNQSQSTDPLDQFVELARAIPSIPFGTPDDQRESGLDSGLLDFYAVIHTIIRRSGSMPSLPQLLVAIQLLLDYCSDIMKDRLKELKAGADERDSPEKQEFRSSMLAKMAGDPIFDCMPPEAKEKILGQISRDFQQFSSRALDEIEGVSDLVDSAKNVTRAAANKMSENYVGARARMLKEQLPPGERSRADVQSYLFFGKQLLDALGISREDVTKISENMREMCGE